MSFLPDLYKFDTFTGALVQHVSSLSNKYVFHQLKFISLERHLKCFRTNSEFRDR